MHPAGTGSESELQPHGLKTDIWPSYLRLEKNIWVCGDAKLVDTSIKSPAVVTTAQSKKNIESGGVLSVKAQSTVFIDFYLLIFVKNAWMINHFLPLSQL